MIQIAPKPLPPANTILSVRSEWLQGDNSPDAGVDVRMHPLTLRFDDRDLEREFEEEYYSRTLIQVRWALVVGLFLYSVYGVVDFWLAPEQRPQIWVIRYVIVAPVALACLGFTFSRHFRKYREPAVSLLILIALLGIVGMTSIDAAAHQQPVRCRPLHDHRLRLHAGEAQRTIRVGDLRAFTLAFYPLAA